MSLVNDRMIFEQNSGGFASAALRGQFTTEAQGYARFGGHLVQWRPH
jgi:hypothetical protein